MKRSCSIRSSACFSNAPPRRWTAPDTIRTAYDGPIGVYAGSSLNAYLGNLLSNPDVAASLGGVQLLLAGDKDHLPTRVSYKLGLRGPSVNVQTACSTSLVAVHLGCRSLLDYECDMALAGGVSIGLPLKGGYRFVEGGILSPDGHCRAFDARGAGNRSRQRLRRRRPEAADRCRSRRRRDPRGDPRLGDQQRWVRQGRLHRAERARTGRCRSRWPTRRPASTRRRSVTSRRTAPERRSATRSRCAALTARLSRAHDAHVLLRDRFAQDQRRPHGRRGRRWRADQGRAGAASIGEVPPTLHYQQPNPDIEFAAGPFSVNSELPRLDGGSIPRRAGVSSFGLGGTNAHVVLEQAPMREPSSSARPWQRPAARRPAHKRRLARMASRFADHLRG